MCNVLKVKPYEVRKESDIDGENYYILSFDQSSHVKVSTRAMEIVNMLDGTKNNAEVVESLNRKGISITKNDFDYFIKKFLIPKGMLINSDSKSKVEPKASKSKLWLHLPLIESSRLTGLYRPLKYLLYYKSIVFSCLSAVMICLLLSIYTIFTNDNNILSEMNSLLILILVYISMFIHELGHATSAYKYGVQVGKIGIGIYLAYFVFFIDMTNTWRLDRSKRIENDLSGMYFQLMTIVPIYIAYIGTGNISLLYAIVIIFFASAMNLIPFLRMDGYWLLSDYLNIQNVQVKAFYSIKQLHIAFKNKMKNKEFEIKKSIYVYGIYSIVYVLTTSALIIFIAYSFIEIILNYEALNSKVLTAYNHIATGNVSSFLVDLNNLFILMIPIIFVISFIVSFFKGLYQRFKTIGGLKTK